MAKLQLLIGQLHLALQKLLLVYQRAAVQQLVRNDPGLTLKQIDDASYLFSLLFFNGEGSATSKCK